MSIYYDDKYSKIIEPLYGNKRDLIQDRDLLQTTALLLSACKIAESQTLKLPVVVTTKSVF